MSSKKTRQRRAAQRAAVAAPHRTAPREEPEAQALNRRLAEAIKGLPGRMTIDAMLNVAARTGVDHLIENNEYHATRMTQDYSLMDRLYRSDWIAGRIINTIPEDMTKNWFELTGSIDPDMKGQLRALERRTHLQAKILEGLRWGRLYGGAAGIMVIKGQEDMLDEPLDLDTVTADSFRGLLIADRWNGVYPSTELVEDLDDPDFGLPEYYTFALADTEIEQGVRVHHSRVVRFEGRDLPYVERVNEQYWGMSELEHIYDELNKRNATSANIAQLIFIAHLRVLKIEDLGQALALTDAQSQQDLYQTIRAQNMLMNNFSLQVLSQEDDFQTFQYSFSGLSEVYEQFMMDLAGAAEIPATKLFGRAPQGLNATGEGDLRNYYDTVKQAQERLLRPILEKLLPVLAVSCWGAVPDDMDLEFNPIRDTSDEERAALIQQSSSAILQAFQGGLISQQIALKELRQSGAAYAMWTNISDEDIDNADDTIAQPDEMASMSGMGGMEGMEGEPPPEMSGEAPPEETEPQPQEMQQPQKPRQPKQPQQPPQEVQEDDALFNDGGPGSGNWGHPGYPRGGRTTPVQGTGQRRAGLGERIRMMARLARPVETQHSRRPPQSKAEVARNNRERREWSELTLGQRIRGASEQNRHMRQVKREAFQAAARGDVERARRIQQQNRHYWSNDPDGAMKVQSETLRRQKRARPGLMHRLFGGGK